MSVASTRRRRRHLRRSKDPVGFDHTPVSPILHRVLSDCREHLQVRFEVISGDRRDGVAQHFGKMSQKELWECWVHFRDTGRCSCSSCNPANPPGTTTHTYRNGGTVNGVTGTPAYHTLFPFGAVLPPWALGLDLANNDQATALKEHATRLGYHFFQPYNSGSELHHLNMAANPLDNLIKRGRA